MTTHRPMKFREAMLGCVYERLGPAFLIVLGAPIAVAFIAMMAVIGSPVLIPWLIHDLLKRWKK